MNKDQSCICNSDEELEALARRFESCELLKNELHHEAHVAVSVWYFLRLPDGEAVARIYDGLQRFIKHHRINVYNETITLFWIKLIRRFVAGADRSRSAYEIANDAAQSLGDSRIMFSYYTNERIRSEAARTGWVEPDLKSLDF